MKNKLAPTIRSRLVLLVMACVVPAALLVAALIVHGYRHDKAQIIRDSRSTARALMAAVDRDLAGVQSALFALAASPALSADDLAGFYGHARDVVNRQIATNIVLLDPSLQQRVNTLTPFGDPLPVERNLVFKRVFEQRRPIATDIFVGPVARKPLLAVAVPVIRDDVVVYVLAAGIWPERLSRALTEQRLPPDWIGAIFDSTGTIVARTHEPERFVGQKGAPALVARMSEHEEGALETTTVEGIHVLSVFSKSGISNWSVALGVPSASVTRDLRTAMWWLVAGTAFLLMGVLVLAWLISERITAAVRSLVEPALALGRGELVAAPTLGIREANEVAHALADASRMLDEARHRANHDVLTGIANRALFDEILGQQLALSRRTKKTLAVLAIDLDGFKPVNDVHGHAVGDEVLRAVAGRLKSAVRESDLVARLGGDEFAAVLVDTGRAAAGIVCAKLIESLSSPYTVGSATIEISASIGVAVYPDSGSTIEALLHRADEAMYAAKSAGKRRYVDATP